MTDYRLLNTRLLAEISRDLALTPAELDRIAAIRRRERRLRGYLADLARLARQEEPPAYSGFGDNKSKEAESAARLHWDGKGYSYGPTYRNVIQFRRGGSR